jgi:hypothetical protein
MKLSKRDFVKAAAATSVALAMAERVRSEFDVDVVVYNGWYPQARAFAATFPAGTRALAVEGDAGALWYGTLRTLVDGGLRRIAGMTTHTDLLILETLAREKGLKASYRRGTGRIITWMLT